MTPDQPLPAWRPAQLHREIQAWIAYYAHALPRPAPDLDRAMAHLAHEAIRRFGELEATLGWQRREPLPLPPPPVQHAPPEHLTEAMILDALERRVAETLALDAGAPGHVDAALALIDTIDALRLELRLDSHRAIEPSWAAWEAATDLLERALGDCAIVPRRAARAA